MLRRGLIVLSTAVFFGSSQHPGANGVSLAASGGPSRAVSTVHLPAIFVANAGQLDRDVRFYSRGARHAVFATDDGVTLALESQTRGLALRLTFVTGSPSSYEIRFGTTNAPPTVESNTTEYWYATPRLNPGTTYYWQIVAKNSDGTTAGSVWSFTTDPTAEPPPSPR